MKYTHDYELGMMPPQAVDLEEVLIGSLLLESDLWDKIQDVDAEYFYKESHQVIFKSIAQLYTDKEPIDLMTVTNRLRSNGELDNIGGPVFLTSLMSSVVSGSHFDYHLHIIKQKYIQREIITITHEINRLAYSDDTESITECEKKITTLQNFLIDQTVGDIDGESIHNLTIKSINAAQDRISIKNQGEEVGIPIPIGRLQDILGGWQRTDLVLIAARPSMGKTAVAIKFAKYAAKRGYKSLIFSLEMSKISLTDRAVLGETDINPEDWRNGNISSSELDKIDAVRDKIKSWPLIIYDKSGLRPEQIYSICKKERPDIIFIDYIQLMKKNKGEKFDRKDLEIGHLSSEMKSIAKEFTIPVIALSQLNRSLEVRASKVPTLGDLRESGNLEQDADIVIFPYRPYVYTGEKTDKGKIEFIIAKHRNGRTGAVDAGHNNYMNDFFDISYIPDPLDIRGE